MNELTIRPEFNMYPKIIEYSPYNPHISSPNADYDLYFYSTRETLMNPEEYRAFIKNTIGRFRRSKYYKDYKARLMSIGLNRCQAMGNITSDDVGEAGIELHHNIITLFDIAVLITEHVLNTVGMICSCDLEMMLILEHQDDNVPIVFLSQTAHQLYTDDPEGYIPPEMTFGKWWVLLNKYRYGITLDIANRVIKYIQKYRDGLPISIDTTQQEQIMSFAMYNEYGMPKELCGYYTGVAEEEEDYV